MTVKRKIDFYNGVAQNFNLKKFYSNDDNLNKKLDILNDDLLKGFSLFKPQQFKKMINGHNEIPDFAEQFVVLNDYYLNNNKYSNSEQQYIILYGEKLGKEKWKNKSESMKGEKNPGFNHNGKYSPFCKDSINYSEDSLKRAQENRNYTTRIDYYLNKGYNQEESEFLLKSRQSTFSLKKCIDKLGEEEGLKRFNARQEKWQNTLNLKSDEEKEIINKAKSSGIGIYLDRNIKGHLYYIHFFTETMDFWKVGITSKNINERFNFDILGYKHHLYHEVLLFEEFDTIQQAYDIEQMILLKFKEHRIIIDMPDFYTTEAFNVDVLNGVYDEII